LVFVKKPLLTNQGEEGFAMKRRDLSRDYYDRNVVRISLTTL